MSQYNQGSVYNWGQFSPFQSHVQINNSYPINYPTDQSVAANNIHGSPFQANKNYLGTQAYLNYSQGLNTPSYDRSFASSGYASGNSSFNSPNNYFRNYSAYNCQSALSNNSFNDSLNNGCYQQNIVPAQVSLNYVF